MARGRQIAAKIEAAHAELFGLMEGLGEEEMTRPGLNGEWSLKDLIGHVGIYEGFVADFLRRRGWPKIPPEIDLPDVDQRNAAIYRYLKDRPLGQVVADEAAAFEALVTAVASLEDADLDDPTGLGLPEGPGWAPEEFIAGSSWDHYPDHVEDVRQWVAQLRA